MALMEVMFQLNLGRLLGFGFSALIILSDTTEISSCLYWTALLRENRAGHHRSSRRGWATYALFDK